ncbi:MAG: hypothetical protein ACOC1U_09985, partial [Spirochaetota bacterium]
MKRLLHTSLILLTLFVASCAPEIVEEPFEPSASHQDYREALERLDLDETALGADWISAAERALGEPVIVQTPFSETVFLDPQDPSALGYEFAVERGRAIVITIASEAERTFADLFRVEDPDDADSRATVLVGSRPEGGTEIRFEPRRDGWYLLRIQPELL